MLLEPVVGGAGRVFEGRWVAQLAPALDPESPGLLGPVERSSRRPSCPTVGGDDGRDRSQNLSPPRDGPQHRGAPKRMPWRLRACRINPRGAAVAGWIYYCHEWLTLAVEFLQVAHQAYEVGPWGGDGGDGGGNIISDGAGLPATSDCPYPVVFGRSTIPLSVWESHQTPRTSDIVWGDLQWFDSFGSMPVNPCFCSLKGVLS
jgi:hypothetical protein